MGAREPFRNAVDYLRRRKLAYQLAFNSTSLVTNMRRAYWRVFANPAGQNVLLDLAVFCRANESCYHDDPRKHAVAEGRREVWLRIQNHLRLSSDQLYAIYAGQHFQTQAEESHDG